jgi:coenzyme PQQ precursor peptide PqqA
MALSASTAPRRTRYIPQKTANEPQRRNTMTEMTWTTPEACEVCVGMEVTSYMSAEI